MLIHSKIAAPVSAKAAPGNPDPAPVVEKTRNLGILAKTPARAALLAEFQALAADERIAFLKSPASAAFINSKPCGKGQFLARADVDKISPAGLASFFRTGGTLTDDAAKATFTAEEFTPLSLTRDEFNALTPSLQNTHCKFAGKITD